MGVRTDQEFIARWRDEPAPLLPILHAINDRDGYLSKEALRNVSHGLRIPLADLYGTVTFYHHFSLEPGGLMVPRVCMGPVCAMKGGKSLLDELREEAAEPMPCAGRCDDPIPVLRGHGAYAGINADGLKAHLSPLPPAPPPGVEECVFAHIRERSRAGILGYRRSGGYRGLKKAFGMSPGDVIQAIQVSALNGRGGAGFPTWRKWRAVRDAPGAPKTIVCNADEGEPGCFKDRAIMDHDPHAVLEGMLLAGYATGAPRGIIYLRYEYPETFRVLTHALHEAKAEGFLGERILGTDYSFEIFLRRGAGAYICGEETSLLNSLEGKHPFPRNRPPFPVTHGFENLPTVVNNVETLATVPHILERGSEWYRGLGMNGEAGTKIISLSGDIRRPGNYEVPMGFPLRELLEDWGGGAGEGRTIQVVTMAGLSGGFLAGEDLDVTLDEPAIRAKGSFLGAGGIMVFDDTRDIVDVARMAMEFFAEESCGKCFPCRIGTRRLTERLAGQAGPGSLAEWTAEVTDLGLTMKEISACGLGMAAPLITESLLRYFPDAVARHVQASFG